MEGICVLPLLLAVVSPSDALMWNVRSVLEGKCNTLSGRDGSRQVTILANRHEGKMNVSGS